jgi:hypothetical protein
MTKDKVICPQCKYDMTQQVILIPSWYLSTQGDLVCEKCSHHTPYNPDTFYLINLLKSDLSKKNNTEFYSSNNYTNNKKKGRNK